MDGRTYDRNEEYEQIDRDLERYNSSDKTLGGIDMPFFILTVLILTIGVIMVLSASFARAYIEDGKPAYYFIRQALFAIAGVAIMLMASRFPVAFYRRMSSLVLGIAIICLILVPFIGTTVNNATRWIDLGFTTFQPSEIAKLGVILFFASMICQFKDKMQDWRYGLVPFGVILVIICALLMLEPHFSACIIIIGVGAIMMFVGGTDIKWFVFGAVGVAAAAYIIIVVVGYNSSRIEAWLDPFSDPQGSGWQIIQSLLAVGSGGLTGLGLGKGRQKYLYLPEEHNDFIFAVFCEELGFIGALLILVLFSMLILRGYWIALKAKNRYGSLIAMGLTSLLAIQVILNIAVVTNLIPCTGISLPFFSYGGTALLVQLLEMGIILAVSREIPLKPRRRRKRDDDQTE